MSGTPIRDGAVLIGVDGKLIAIGLSATVPRPPDADASDWPGRRHPSRPRQHPHPSRAHRIRGPGGGSRLPRLDPSDPRAQGGAAPLRISSRPRAPGWPPVTLRGSPRWPTPAIPVRSSRRWPRLGGSGVAYHEVFGPHPDQLRESLAVLQQRVAELRRFTSARVRLGVSPHAPYTVSAELYRGGGAVSPSARTCPSRSTSRSREAESELLHRRVGALRGGVAGPGHPAARPTFAGSGPPSDRWLDAHGVLGARHALPSTRCRPTPADLAALAERRDRGGPLSPVQCGARPWRGAAGGVPRRGAPGGARAPIRRRAWVRSIFSPRPVPPVRWPDFGGARPGARALDEAARALGLRTRLECLTPGPGATWPWWDSGRDGPEEGTWRRSWPAARVTCSKPSSPAGGLPAVGLDRGLPCRRQPGRYDFSQP